MIVGVAKETYDYYDYGNFSKSDLLADGLGCAAGAYGVEWLKGYSDGDAVGVSFNMKFK